MIRSTLVDQVLYDWLVDEKLTGIKVLRKDTTDARLFAPYSRSPRSAACNTCTIACRSKSGHYGARAATLVGIARWAVALLLTKPVSTSTNRETKEEFNGSNCKWLAVKRLWGFANRLNPIFKIQQYLASAKWRHQHDLANRQAREGRASFYNHSPYQFYRNCSRVLLSRELTSLLHRTT